VDKEKPFKATAEHREPCDSRGSCTVLGAPGGEIPPGDSTYNRTRYRVSEGLLSINDPWRLHSRQ
jgi:hypothetical protein